MFKRMFRSALIGLLFSFAHHLAFAATGDLFKVTSSGGAQISITLCLNINGQNSLSCENHITQAGVLTIGMTVPNHVYHHAGLRINTPGYVFTPSHGLKLNKKMSQANPTAALNPTVFVPLPTLSTTPKTLGSVTQTTGTAPSITSAASAAFTYNVSSVFTVTATGTPVPTFSETGPLPAGVSLDQTTGALSGTPATSGTFPITITATKSVGTTTQAFTLTVSPATPTISWPTPAAITYGTALTATQLNATASVPGTFVYTPASGTILVAGNHALSVTFTPTDTMNYTTPLAAKVIFVEKAPATVTISQSSAQSTLGEPVTYTATINPILTGAITFTSTVTGTTNSTAINGCINLSFNTDRTATCIAALSANQYSISTENYSNPNYTATYSAVTQSVRSPSATVLSSSLNPSVNSGSVTFTANIVGLTSEPVGTGNVVFTATDVGLTATTLCDSSINPVNVTSGKATCTTSALTATNSPYSVIASYSGGINVDPKISAAFSQYVTSSTIATTVPAAPISVSAVPGNGQVTVSWFPPSNTGGAEITGYTVHYGSTSSPTYLNLATCTINNNTCIVNGLINHTPYTFTVAATNTQSPTTPIYGPVAYSSSTTPLPALSASPSTLALSSLGAYGGFSRTITITNNSGSDVYINEITIPQFLNQTNPFTPVNITTTTCPSPGTFASGATCAFVIKPGTTVSSDTGYTFYTACTDGAAPVSPSQIVITYDTDQTLTADVVILGYGCQYQGGFVFSIDDWAPFNSSIGGTVAAAADGPYASGSSSVVWSPDDTSIWGISEQSNIANPDPNSISTSPATLAAHQLNCSGTTDGSCNTNNIYINYNNTAPPTVLNTYATGICKQKIDSSGTLCTDGLSCYTDWYLPSSCEIGSLVGGSSCPPGIDNMFINLSILVTDPSCIAAGCFLNDSFYWSSTEASYLSNSQSFYWHFPTNSIPHGYSNATSKSSNQYTRCARALTL